MIRRQTLYSKLLLLFLGFGALMVAAFFIVMNISHETYHLEFDQVVNRDLARQYVAQNLLIRAPPLTAHNYAASLNHITAINPDVDVHVLDAQGNILASSTSNRPVLRTRVAIAPVKRFVAGTSNFPLLGDDPTDEHRRGVFSVAPLSIPDCPAAYLYIVLHREERTEGGHQLKTTYAIHEGLGILLVAVAAAVAASLLFLRLLTRRLSALQQDIEQFQASEFSILPALDGPGPDVQAGDDIERLRVLFVKLAERIRSQMQELQKTAEIRRELFANVSHDLRTPLATLHAHLETLSVKDELSAEDRRTYLAISMRQSQRLIKLTERLLDLAELDARQIQLSPERFQLAELAHDVAMKFNLTAKRRGIAVEVVHPEQVPLVTADIGLIEQVFSNLIENAVRYAPAASMVTVRLIPQHHAVRVEIHDRGPGIPAGERERVFERFYRGDKSRSSESGHAGLGLALVRGILDLHGRSVDFVSTAAEGTTFFFDLPTTHKSNSQPEPNDVSPHRTAAADNTTRRA